MSSEALWTRDTVLAATGGKCEADFTAQGVSIDTRTLNQGDLFVALTAARDGHDFVAGALKRGAAAALVSRIPDGLTPDAPLILVQDVLGALEVLGRAARARFKGRVVAVTGSVGKTSTKEMLRCVLSAQGRVHAAEKSYNNHWGVPLTLARMPADCDFAVIEIGMNAPGEIAPLSRMAQPHVAIITNVEAVHMAAFTDLRGIAMEKAAIMDGLVPGETIILNRDTGPYSQLLRRARRLGLNLRRFGATGRPEYHLCKVTLSDDTTAVFARMGKVPFFFNIGAPGRHLAMNALAVLAAVEALGGDLARAGMALNNWRVPQGRGARWRIPMGTDGVDGEILLIDESYNANPAAMNAALDVFAHTQTSENFARHRTGRRVAFLGDMLELGADEDRLHADLSKAAAFDVIDVVHCVGERMHHLYDALPMDKCGRWEKNSATMAKKAKRLLDAGDVVMVKGSLGSRMGVIVEAIKELGPAQPAEPEDG